MEMSKEDQIKKEILGDLIQKMNEMMAEKFSKKDEPMAPEMPMDASKPEDMPMDASADESMEDPKEEASESPEMEKSEDESAGEMDMSAPESSDDSSDYEPDEEMNPGFLAKLKADKFKKK